MTMFWNNYSYFNPAMSGLNYRHEGTFTARNQWPSSSINPMTFFGSYSAKVNALHGGAGITAMNDRNSYYSGSKIMLNYSFHMQLGEESVLAIGAAAGIFHVKTQFEKLTFPEIYAYEMNGTGTAFNSNIGIAYRFKKLNVGASITNLNEPSFPSGTARVSAARNYWFFADYLLQLSPGFALKPAALYQTDGIVQSAQASLRAILKGKYWLGVNVRSRDTFGAMVGVDLKEKFRIGYSYDVTTSRLNNGVSMPSHELTFNVLIK